MKFLKFLFSLLIITLSIFLSACQSEIRPDLGIDLCYQDQDCVQWVLCGCHTKEYIKAEMEQATQLGIMYDACFHPPNSYCACIDNRCQQLIDEEERKELAEKFTINNSVVENIPNLIYYNEEEILTSNLSFDDYIISWPISINKAILTDGNIEIINLNLPGDINMLLQRTEYNHDRWNGIIISDDPMFSKNDKMFFSTLNKRFLATVMPYQIKGENYTYIITSDNIKIK